MLDVVMVYGAGANRHVLLVRPEGGAWEVPFGAAEAGEATRSAAARILWNQCGLNMAEAAPVHTWRDAVRACLYLAPHPLPVSPGGPVAAASWWPVPDGIGTTAPVEQGAGKSTVLEEMLAPEGGLYRPHRRVLAVAVAWLEANGR